MRFRNSESLANQPSVAYALDSWKIFKKAGCKQSSVLVVAYASVAGKVLDLYKMFLYCIIVIINLTIMQHFHRVVMV